MPWFLVDDSLPDHPKVDELLAEPNGFAAIGLWTVCGAWSMRHLTDGHVPASRVRRLSGRRKLAELLVRHGLWEQVGDGYQFHDWTSYQPTKAAILAKRQARAEAGKKGGLASGESRREANASSKTEAVASSTVEPPDPRPNSQSQIPGPSQSRELARGSAKPPSRANGGKTGPAWEAYAHAYRARYGEDPIRNARINGQLAQLVQRLPAEDVAGTVEHYLSSNNARYVQAGHSVGCLLQDCEALRTEAVTGRRRTAHAARQADSRDGRGQVYLQAKAELEAEERARETK